MFSLHQWLQNAQINLGRLFFVMFQIWNLLLHPEYLQIFQFPSLVSYHKSISEIECWGIYRICPLPNKGEILRLACPSQTLPMDMQYSTSGISTTRSLRTLHKEASTKIRQTTTGMPYNTSNTNPL